MPDVRTRLEKVRFLSYGAPKLRKNGILKMAKKINVTIASAFCIQTSLFENMYCQRYALLATEDYDSNCVVIVLGHTRYCCLKLEVVEAIKVANSLYDFLQGKMVGNSDYKKGT